MTNKKPLPSFISFPPAVVAALMLEHRDGECYCIDEVKHACNWCAVEALLSTVRVDTGVE